MRQSDTDEDSEAEPTHDEHREMTDQSEFKDEDKELTDQGVGKLQLFGMCLQESSVFLPS